MAPPANSGRQDRIRDDTTGQAARLFCRVNLSMGRRAARRVLGWLVVDDQQLEIRSLVSRWIPDRPARHDDVGEITVSRKIEVHLPIVRWRRLDVVTFGSPSGFADISLELSPGKQVITELRVRGYSVTDHTS